ncbi:hypothetical protein SK128_027391 [Halocaridina rubra]|uniref:ABC transporter domain-containing protein n=1 Tax=Halocaridina rubra TaxID=373956 RepID=A0AAN9AA52_HALRR
MGTNLLSCIKLERFVPVNNEEEMTEEAKNAVSMNKFLAGIVFHGVGQTGDTEVELPKGIKYSIRVDYEKTPSTSQLGPRFWRPGPYANMAVHMKYHQGFLLLQEMVDQAILQLQVNENIPAMSYFASALHARYSYADNVRRTSKGRSSSNRDIFVSSNFSSESLLSGFRHSVSRYKRQIIGSQPITLTPEEAKMILDIPIYTKQQPYPCYDSDGFMEMLNASPVLSLVLSFITFTIFIVFLIQQLVTEKKSRNKQVQEVMGLKIWLDHLVWFFYAILLLLLIVLLLTLIIKFGGLQPKAHFGILFAFLLCYGISLIAFCYLVSSLIVSPVLAVFVGVMSTLIFNVPFITISVLQTSTPLASVIASCILPSSAFGFGYRIICQFELLAVGIHYGNIWTSPVRGSELTLGLAIVMLLVDTVLFFVLAVVAVFLKNVLSCGCGTPNKVTPPAKGSLSMMKKDNIRTVDVDPGVKQSLRKGLSIVGLRRIYQHRGRSKVAVDNLSLELYEGQIFALLGHNGAGKTTTISIITREVEATAGNVQVYGHDIRTSWNKARSLIGLCPQEAVLFPFLTVQEILLYYSILKGTPSDRTNPEVNMVLIDMGLFNHRHYLGSQLSEGLRRRVCLAVAFVGGSKLIILDEPTSGVDPAARSAIWEVISNNRSGKTILLTTHHLDEAETLADRVAIMHRGQLLCVGSPLSLKAEYGSGYSITLSNRLGHHQTDNARDITQSMANMKRPNSVKTFANVNIATPNTSAAWALIKKYVPNAKLLEALNGEVTYSVPFVNEKEEENRLVTGCSIICSN